MKIISKTTTAAIAFALAAMVYSPNLNAQLVLRYEEGPNVGQLYSGDYQISFDNFDMGALYPAFPSVGDEAGFNGVDGIGPQTVQAGVTTLDGIQSSPAEGAENTLTTIDGVAQAGTLGLDDSWGIARVSRITDLNGVIVWSEFGTNQQLTIFFYGEKDFYIQQLANGFQEINGAGLHVDFYLQDKSDVTFTNYINYSADPTNRTGLSTFTGITDGELVLSAVSTPTLIHDDGDRGGLATEFLSNYNQTSGGTGQTYLSVTGGTSAAEFDTNNFTSPFGTGKTADIHAQFTTNAATGGEWLVSSRDPATGVFAPVPEPSTYGIVAAGALAGMIAIRRRRQKTAA